MDVLLERILADSPKFHRQETEVRGFDPSLSSLSSKELSRMASEGRTCHGISKEFARELRARLKTGMRTLETGAGVSTLIFGMSGAHHTAITPDAEEADAIKAHAEKVGIDLSRVTFAIAASERFLSSASLPELDIVLIDGKHAFPWPMLDWFYTAEALKPDSGLLMLDDVDLRSVAVLVDFLRADPHWRLEGVSGGRTMIFRRLGGGVHEIAWHMQPWIITRPTLAQQTWFFVRRIPRIPEKVYRAARGLFQ